MSKRTYRHPTTRLAVEFADLTYRQLPHSEEMERTALKVLIVGHHLARWAFEEEGARLVVDDFYLGKHELRGWIFMQLRWGCRKRRDPIAELMKSTKFLRYQLNGITERDLMNELKTIIKMRGEARALPAYIDILKELSEWRSKIVAAEDAFCNLWKEFDDECIA